MQSHARLSGMFVTVAAGMLLAGCGAASSSPNAGATSSPGAAPIVETRSITVSGSTETVLKDSRGMTLYYFTPDSATTVACTGSCAGIWPPLISSTDNPSSASSLPGHLTVVNGANGKQVEYNDHPLYTYAKDSTPADANGQGLFGKWFVATPALAMAAAPSASKSTSSYNPY